MVNGMKNTSMTRIIMIYIPNSNIYIAVNINVKCIHMCTSQPSVDLGIVNNCTSYIVIALFRIDK